MDVNQQMQAEAAELQLWQQVAQLAQSGDANALPQIMQIAQKAIQMQEAEMKEMQPGGEGMPQQSGSFKERLMAKMAEREQAAQGQGQGQEE